MVEVFVNDRQAAVWMQPHDKAHTGVRVFAEGAAVDVRAARAWQMQSIYR